MPRPVPSIPPAPEPWAPKARADARPDTIPAFVPHAPDARPRPGVSSGFWRGVAFMLPLAAAVWAVVGLLLWAWLRGGWPWGAG